MKKSAVIAMLAAAVAVGAGGARMVYVHDAYGEWQLTATQTPTRIAAFGRDFDRSELEPTRSAPPGLVERGKTSTGGAILVPEHSEGAVPIVIYVRDGEGQVWSYGLVGGP